MFFLLHIFMTFFALIAIIYTCILFTNAIEHLGNNLKLSSNATGSILAAIGTGFPETVVPLVAIFGAIFFNLEINTAQEIAQGAIIGSPFMLGTLSLFFLGVTLCVLLRLKKRNNQELSINHQDILRNIKYFLFAYTIAICASFFEYKIKVFIILFLIFLYLIYVYRTIKLAKDSDVKEEIESLIFSKFFKRNNKTIIYFQIFISLLFLIIFSHVFVNEITFFSNYFSISPTILSLIITPFATELPECVNSIIWVKNSKDNLAIANILGAMVFQTMVPFSIGITLTSWKISQDLFINIILILSCMSIFGLHVLQTKKINFKILIFCGIFYLAYLFILFV